MSSGVRAIAIVGVGAVLPDAGNAAEFWQNIRAGRSSITDVPADRWDPALYYDADPRATDRTYSRIGGWVRQCEWNPLAWKLPIPPRVGDVMDATQKWAVVAAREALADYGFPNRPLDHERTAVILGNAMGGDNHLQTAVRILFPEVARDLENGGEFRKLPAEVRRAVIEELTAGVRSRIPDITEDTMPGELSNITAGRIAALFDFRGPNFVTDAACASAMAAITAAVEGLESGAFDAVLTGGIDANMSASSFVKFCKIGALSATGSRPYAAGADGFVMGEGGVVFVLKRLADAERAGDRVYAVIRGIGSSSDGKGKGITAPNPVGQKLAVQRAWQDAGLRPERGDMVEGHGTSTRVGDVVEVSALSEVLGADGLAAGSLALGSVKSNLGHLKAAAGAAGVLKAALALRDRVLPPSINFSAPNPDVDFSRSPLRVQTELADWHKNGGGEGIRRAGVSSFGFGGTNFHLVLEEYVPGRLQPRGVRSADVVAEPRAADSAEPRQPLRGALVLGARDDAELGARLRTVLADAGRGALPVRRAPLQRELDAPVRLAIDYGEAAELVELGEKALAALESGEAGRWRALRNKGVFLGRGPAGKVAFLFTGQGSQYANMLHDLRDADSIVADTFAEADAVITPMLGSTLTSRIFVESRDEALLAQAEEALRQTTVTQPAVLTVDTAMARLFQAYGVKPDMVMGHSLGEYGALVAAGVMPFADALKAVSVRGEAMTDLSLGDNGLMAAVFGPLERVQAVLDTVAGYAVIANINSTKECVVGGATEAMQAAMEALRAAGMRVTQLPVSHAFHTQIVAPAAGPLTQTLRAAALGTPRLPVIANVTGDFYPADAGAEQIVEILGQQVGSPVQFVKGLHTLYQAGARVFIEMGPKRTLHGLVEDVLGDHEDVVSLYTNHPRTGDLVSVNRALCGCYALGLGAGRVEAAAAQPVAAVAPAPVPAPPARSAPPVATQQAAAHAQDDRLLVLGRMFADVLEKGLSLYGGGGGAPPLPRVGITGAALGLPGRERAFDDGHVARILAGEQFISQVPEALRQAMAGRGITRLVKGAEGHASFEQIDDPADVIKLAGRCGAVDLVSEFGFPEDRDGALDRVTRIAIAAGLDALRDAGIPLVQRYRTTTTGSRLPIGWALPEDMRDDTGIVFASAFPGYDNFARTITEFEQARALKARLAELQALRRQLADAATRAALDARIAALEQELAANPYRFDRRFLFQVLSMGHSQFAEYIGARGPNVATNAACASATQAVALASDWIQAGRCRRVIVITADDITTDTLFPWFGSGFLASGAAATDERVEEAALPFDRRRHGLLIGSGGAALVVEALDASAERAVQPICEILGSVVANSAYHGSRLDVDHIVGVMERLVSDVERRCQVDRRTIASQLVFVSHETYTPARGGSASAEVFALRRVFGDAVNHIVVANTKGYTGHPMAVGIEDTLAVKMLETGVIPPVANFREIDPELGTLNLSRGGSYPVRYALRLGAGFGSQIAMTLLEWLPPVDGARRSPHDLGFRHRITDQGRWQEWLRRASGESDAAVAVVRRTLRVVAGAGRTAAAPVEVRPAAAPQVAAPAPAAVPAAPAAALAVAASDPVRTRVLAIVAEQTGYPSDMLDLDLDLEADLGIDTVKQAEMFAAIRAEYDIERDENIALRDYATLARAIEFVYEKRPELRPAAAAAAPALTAPAAAVPATSAPSASAPATIAPPASAPAPASDPVRAAVIRIVAEQTGYPADMLDLDLDLEADLGIDTVKQAEMFAAIRAEYDIERDENIALRDYPTLARAIEFVYEKRPDLRAAAPAAAPAVAAPPQASLPVPADTGAGPDAVRAAVIRIVAEQTGYPADMLDLDLDLEADLGIDTVKQAEMFAAIRAQFDIERDENIALRDYPTLARAIEFVYEKRPELRAGAGAAPAAPPAAKPGAAPGAEAAVLQGDDAAAYALPRRVPAARVRPDVSAFAPSGVTLAAGDRVIVCGDRAGVADALVARLEKRGVVVLALDAALAPAAVAEQAAAWRAEGPVRGVYWLPALDIVEYPALLAPDTRATAVQLRVKGLYQLLRTLYETFADAGSFLVSATRLGGRHGYDASGASDVLGGAVAGLTKSFARERPEALVKVVDFPIGRQTAAHAERLLDETLHDAGVVEVGYVFGRRWQVSLEAMSYEQPEPLAAGGTWVITGAAGSIVSAIVGDLARATLGDFWLLDVTPAPDAADPDLARLDGDREALKRDLFARLQATGARATPALVEKELARLERARAALATIQAVESAGGRAHYRSVDLRDAGAVAAVCADIRAQCARVDVLLHAAGLEISRALPDKKPEEFDLVFDVKTEGWFNLVGGLAGVPLGAAVAFSSIAGRFGNAGQADYSAANDLLCKAMSALPRTHGARGIAIDWTAWAEIGMAARGSIPAIMKSAGIDMLPPRAGIPVVRLELGGAGGEVVIAEALGAMLQERAPQGGWKEPGTSSGLLAAQGFDVNRGLVAAIELDPAAQPFLFDHAIGGTAVLPGVMGIELMTEAARLPWPERVVTSVERIEFDAPFKFYRSEPRTVEVEVSFTLEGEDIVGECALFGTRALHGRTEAERTRHFSARVRLGTGPAPAPERLTLPERSDAGVAAAAIYQLYFHGPAYRVLRQAWREGPVLAGELALPLPPNHAGEATLLVGPRLIELAFQAAGLVEIADTARMGLPRGVDRIELHRALPAEDAGVHAVARPQENGFDIVVCDAEGLPVLTVEGYRTAALPATVDTAPFAALQTGAIAT